MKGYIEKCIAEDAELKYYDRGLSLDLDDMGPTGSRFNDINGLCHPNLGEGLLQIVTGKPFIG